MGHIQFVFARTVREVLNAIFGPGLFPSHPFVESKLQKMGRVLKER